VLRATSRDNSHRFRDQRGHKRPCRPLQTSAMVMTESIAHSIEAVWILADGPGGLGEGSEWEAGGE
jgi:hypothetical protein